MGPKTRRIAALERDKAELQEQLGELTEQLALRETTLQARIADRDDALKKTVDRLAARNALIERLREALLEVAGCEQCDRAVLGVWEWGDEDGEERVCDEHKNSHFYTRGPFQNDKLRSASEALCRAALADAQPGTDLDAVPKESE